jgi:hypothetical protein
MLVVGRFDAYMPPAEGNWRVQRCCQTLKAYIICCFTNWVCLSLVGRVGLVYQDPGLVVLVAIQLGSRLRGWIPSDWLTDPSNTPGVSPDQPTS